MDRPVLPVGAPHTERADAVRNRQHLLATARDMLAGEGADTLTMDALAQRDDDERSFQEQVLSGAPPLGPGAPPLDRLVAYGQARIGFLIEHREVARAALGGSPPLPAGAQAPLAHTHTPEI